MFTKADISSHTNSKSFDRGRLMALSPENINDREVIHLEDAVEIKGHVTSASGWSEYFASCVITDKSLDDIIDFECTCPAYLRFDSMCKHCVALSLTFLENPKSFTGFEQEKSNKTSRSITKLMSKMRTSCSFGEQPHDIEIKVQLKHDFGKWSARFRLQSKDATYVVSSPRDFAEALKNREFVTYGKKLGFTHHLDAFCESSKKIATIISNAIDLRYAIDAVTLAKQMHSNASRDLDLSEYEVVGLLDALGNSTFEFIDTSRSVELYNMHTVDEDPPLSLRIVEDDRGGYTIVRDENMTMACGADATYLFIDDCAYRCSDRLAKASSFLKNVYLSNDDELFIADKDSALFAATLLPLLEDSINTTCPEALERKKPVEGHLSYYFDLIRINGKEFITLDVRVKYGEDEYRIMSSDDTLGELQHLALSQDGKTDTHGDTDGGSEAIAYYDEDLERRAMKAVMPPFDTTLRLALDEEEKVGALIFGGLGSLREVGDVYTTSAFDRLLNPKTPNVQIGLSISGNLLNMDVQPTDIEKDELIALLKSYRRKKHYHRLKSGAFLSIDDMELKNFAKLVEDFGLKPDDVLSGRIHLPAYRAFLLDKEYSGISEDESFKTYIESFEHIDQTAIALPKSLNADMRPYQIEGFRWLCALTTLGFGGILADEMGLGKTLQVISLLLSQKEKGSLGKPALVICPASLVYNWVDEIERFAPSLSVHAIEGAKIDRMRDLRSIRSDILVCSYDIARIDLSDFEKLEFSFVVLDEAQYIKNHATKTTRAIKRLNADHRFALTGTPIENRLSEIWSIFDFLMPGFLGSYAYFMQRYESDILGGDPYAAERLQALVGPFVLRRLKDSVLLELPEKMESVIHVPLSGEQKKLYDALEQDLRISLNEQKRRNSSRSHKRGTDIASRQNNIEVLAELTRLRQIALDPSLVYDNYKGGGAKLDIIIELIEQAMASKRKVLVFSQFTSYLSVIEKALAEKGIDFFEITGQTPKQKRVELVKKFNDDDTPVFLVSLKAGGTGLNLTGASIVIHADPWWNAAATDQATDRAHRIGQDKKVMVYKVIAKNTIEDRIEKLQRKKTDLADSIIREVDSASLSKLTKDELELLLSE